MCNKTYDSIAEGVHLGGDNASVVLWGDVARGAHYTISPHLPLILLYGKGKAKVTHFGTERQV